MNQSNNKNARAAFLLYEPGQVEELERLWRERPEERDDSLVVAFALDVEERLAERGIAFFSGREYKRPSLDLFTTEDKMMETFFADSRWTAFNYRGVALPKTFRFMFRAYLQRVWYYSNLLISIVEIHPNLQRFVLFASSGVVSQVAGGLARREINAIIDCAKTIAAARGMAVLVISLPMSRASLRNSIAISLFGLRRALFGFSLAVWNGAIGLLPRSLGPRLLISDYWKHVGSSIELLPAGECTFIDRTEIRNINWRTLLRYRMRFVHSENFLSRSMRARVSECAREFAREWSGMRSSIACVFICRGYSLDSLLLIAIDDIVRGFGKTMREIEGTYALYEHLQPDTVVLRASVSGQTHFSVLPMVAKAVGIPALELQHGLEYLGAGSLSREHTAEYLAVYGSLIKKELLSIGYEPERVREIGSPRFDAHRASVTTSASQKFTVLCIAPDIRPFEIYDSYSAEDYFTAIARAIETIQDSHAIIKLRSGPAGEGLLRTIIANAFSRVPHTIVQSEALPDLFVRADAVVSCYSTAILEALQCGVPVIIPALNAIDAQVTNFHFAPYRDAGALYISYTQAELAQNLAKLSDHPALRSSVCAKAQAFLADNFCFDGNSSRRFAALITELVHK
jgi:glycosyltransferase involved in cell wall biosynthesis